MFPNISQNKFNQTIKFNQLIKYSKRNIFIKNHAKNGIGRLVPYLFF